MITSGEKQKARDIIRAKHFSADAVHEAVTDNMIRIYGKNQAVNVAKGLIDNKIEEKLLRTTVGFVICEDNYDMIMEAFSKYGMSDEFSARITERGAIISAATDEIVIRLDMGDIQVENLMGEKINENEIYSEETLFQALEEAVSIDMRSKKFKNLCKRRAGEKHCKETEKIDMRTKEYKETKMREEANAKKKREKWEKDNPREAILKKHVMGENEEYYDDDDEAGVYSDIIFGEEVFFYYDPDDALTEEEIEMALEYLCQDEEISIILEDESIVSELTKAERRKRAIAFKKSKKKRLRSKKKNEKKAADDKTIERRATQQARKEVAARLMKGIDKKDMTASQKEKIEKLLKKKKKKIDVIAKKKKKEVRSKDRERLKNRKSGANESYTTTSSISSIAESIIGKK